MRARLSLSLLVTLSVVPLAEADWGARGFHEPDTVPDVRDGFMFHEAPPASATGRVYFNGFLAQGRATQPECLPGGVFPLNVALSCDDAGCPVAAVGLVSPGCLTPSLAPGAPALGLAAQPVPPSPHALLGVWNDCNGDGYIGYGDLGLWEYRAELLGASARCPVVRDPFPLPANWKPSHNDGKWVRELIPIGWNVWGANEGGIRNDRNVYDINDTESRVWADYGLPGEATAGRCNVNPAPRHTFRMTGGLVEWIDCLDGFAVTDAAGEAANATGRQELAFNDARRNQSDSASVLNQRNPWGENGDKPYAEMCSGEEVFLAQDPVPGLGWDHTLKLPPPVPVVHADGSASGQVREAYYLNTWMRCHQGEAPFQRQLAEQPYMLEGDVTNVLSARTQPDFQLHYESGKKPVAPFAAAGASTPNDLGLRLTSPEGLWRADGGAAYARPPVVSRGQLNVLPVQSLTYYANVGATAASQYGLALPGTGGVYGAGACETIGPSAPERNGWACDPAAWWPAGAPRSGSNGGEPYGARVGQPFRLRDVDCYDASTETLRGEGIDQSFLTAVRCPFT